MFKIIAVCLMGTGLSGPALALDLSAPQPYARAAYPGLPAGQDVVARDLIRGPRGGCYYINGNGNKTYVDRSRCR